MAAVRIPPTMSLNGTTVQPVNMEITISRDVEPVKTSNNTQTPYAVFAGPFARRLARGLLRRRLGGGLRRGEQRAKIEPLRGCKL